MLEKLRMALKKYYNAHQISKSINILDLATLSEPSPEIRPLKCICHFLQPKDGWNRKVTNTSAPEEQCFHCMNQLKDNFSDYNKNTQVIFAPSPDNQQCQYCYWYCCRKYVNDSGNMQLNPKFVKKRNLK